MTGSVSHFKRMKQNRRRKTQYFCVVNGWNGSLIAYHERFNFMFCTKIKHLLGQTGQKNVVRLSFNAHCHLSSMSCQPDENKHILALQFSWKNGIKPKGSIFIGVSPEFEFALYTLCFLTSPNERVRIQFSFYHVEIVCHHYNQKHIGTTYPVLLKYHKQV